jgi:hypothetical protein
LLKDYESAFNYKKFLSIIIILIATLLIDTSIVKIYDLVGKGFMSGESKLILFSVNSAFCILLQFAILRYLQNSVGKYPLNTKLRTNLLSRISLVSLLVSSVLLAILTLQMFYNSYYEELIPIFIVIISYGTAAFFVVRLSILFISWYKSSHDRLMFLFLASMLLIAFNLIMTAVVTDIRIYDRADQAREFVGGTVDLSVGGRYTLLNNIYSVTSAISFVSIWITTALLMKYYREKLTNVIIYWLLLSLPLLYFFVNYFYVYILATTLQSNLAIDPITVSIILTAFLTLSKPIGGLTFAIAFWKISKTISYEKNVRTYMIVSGWGILLIFGADQALVQTLAPYPPFGLVTLTVLITSSYLMLYGIYNSASLVSVNNELRKSIYKHTSESKLLRMIGQAELEKEIGKTVEKITKDKAYLMDSSERELVAIDEKELGKYIDLVVKELKKDVNVK